MATLYIVATPIGNLEDVTLRALHILREVDLIVCEDTRVTKRLLERYGVLNKQLMAYNEKQSGVSIRKIIEILGEGKNIALVSDSGTPAISDPGSFLVSSVRQSASLEHIGDAVHIVPIPGPNAAIAALSAAGLPASDFLFLGFLPHKKGRQTLFQEISESERTVVFYESPHRILKTLQSLALCLEVSGDGKHSNGARKIIIARELTKIHEEIVAGTPQEVFEYFDANSDKIRGEFAVLVGSRKK